MEENMYFMIHDVKKNKTAFLMFDISHKVRLYNHIEELRKKRLENRLMNQF